MKRKGRKVYAHTGSWPLLINFLLWLPLLSIGQQADSLHREYRKYDIFPAISYSPETKLSLGALGYRYFDLEKDDPETITSYINFLALFTTARQVLIETNWDIFANGNETRYRGALEFAKFPNRNYGIGNNADALITEYELKDQVIEDSVQRNYKQYSIMRITFTPKVLWEVKKHLYLGFTSDLEWVWNLQQIADSVALYRGGDDILLLEENTTGYRGGLGINILWDSRDYLLNSSAGSLIDLQAKYYGKYLGSKYSYFSLDLDARKFINPIADHTLAMRGFVSIRSTNDASLPIRDLSKIGGSNFVRGYFRGTYQDNSVAAFEIEYRIPFYNEDNLGPIYHYWKRLGMAVFFSGAQVFGKETNFAINRFNLAGGLGLRILFNKASRANLRLDYALGFTPDAGGVGKLQSGFYFTFGEAF